MSRPFSPSLRTGAIPGLLLLLGGCGGNDSLLGPDGAPPNAAATRQAGTNETQITSGPMDFRPSWSPDGTQLAFDAFDFGWDILTIPVGGGGPNLVTTSSGMDRHPDWSPDGTQLVYSARPQGSSSPDLWLIPPGGGTPTLLVGEAGNIRFPAWSPDGSSVAYTKGRDLFVVASSGGVPLRITTDPALDLHPSWSPDGSQIAFLSNRAGNNDIWVIPAAGGTATQITTHSANDGAPDWSPDGATIAFQSKRDGDNDIWTIPAAGGTATQITFDPGNDVQPDWSPSGDRIAFSRGGRIWVYTVPPAPSLDLSVSKSVDDDQPSELDTIVYSIALTNHGPDPATGVEVTDSLPLGVNFVSSAPTQGVYDEGSGLWTVGGVDPAVTATLQITATVGVGTAKETIINTASITDADQGDTDSSNDADSVAIVVMGPAVPKAFYNLNGGHLVSNDWPAAYVSFEIFICNPSLNESQIQQIRADVPGAICLAASSLHDVFLDVFPNDPYFAELSSRFDEDLCIRDLATGELIRIAQTVNPNLPDPPAFVMSQGAADVLVAFHDEVTLTVSWDGLYLDRCLAVFPTGRKNRIAQITDTFDINGDALPDTFDDIDDQYDTWRPYYTSQLRSVLGSQTVIVGNSGGPLADPDLNGICLERVGERYSRQVAEGYVLDQWAVGFPPHLAILWAKSDFSYQESVELALSLGPGAYVGDLR